MNIRQIIREEIESVFTEIIGKSYSKVEYTGVMIEGEEVARLEKEFGDRLAVLGVEFPEGWKKPDDYHMTITLGELSLSMKMAGIIGSEIELEVNSVGVSDKAIAAGVSGLFSRNEHQHITMAYEDRPADSNEITEWIPIKPFKVIGYVREVDKVNGWGKLRQK